MKIFDLKGKLLVHHEIYPDNVKKVVIQRVINEFTDQKGHREKTCDRSKQGNR